MRGKYNGEVMNFPCILSRLTVVSRKAKKGQSDRQKQNARQTTVCLLHKWMFSSFDVIITLSSRINF